MKRNLFILAAFFAVATIFAAEDTADFDMSVHNTLDKWKQKLNEIQTMNTKEIRSNESDLIEQHEPSEEPEERGSRVRRRADTVNKAR